MATAACLIWLSSLGAAELLHFAPRPAGEFPAPWQRHGGDRFVYRYEQIVEDSRPALQITGLVGNIMSNGMVSQTVPLEANTRYKLHARVRQLSGKSALGIFFPGGGGEAQLATWAGSPLESEGFLDIGYLRGEVPTRDSELTVEFATGAQAVTGTIYIGLYYDAGATRIYSVQLEKL